MIKTVAPQTIRFDAWQVLPFGNLENQRQLSQADTYLCLEPDAGYNRASPFPSWEDVWCATQFQGWTVNMAWVTPNWKPLKHKLPLSKRSPPNNCQNLECCPVLITLDNSAFLDQEPKVASQVYGLGEDITRKDPLGRFVLRLIKNSTSDLPGTTPTPDPNKHFSLPNINPKMVTIIEVKNLRQTLETETGYGNVNAWVKWVVFSVQALNKSNCYACAAGPPQAQVVPFPLGWNTDPRGMCCMLALYQHKDAPGSKTCKSLSLLFPASRSSDPRAIPSFSAGNMNYSSCLSRQGAEVHKPMGELSTCTHILNITGESRNGNYSALHTPWADVW
nr:uncharacterized protein LOC129058112 [Pongo abelii]